MMSKLLAFDLSYVGATGWVFWQSDRADPVIDYGEFKAASSKSGAQRDIELLDQISTFVFDLVERFEPDNVVYEITDWHRDLRNSGNYKIDYKIERVTQRALGKAEIAFLVGATRLLSAQSIHSVGANEVKEKFGAKSKVSVARLFAQEYPRFVFETEDKGRWHLCDNKNGNWLSDHISDALALAKVFNSELRLQQMIMEAENGL